MSRRFKSDAESLQAFHDEVLVTCPHCGQCAVVRQQPVDPPVKAGPFRARTVARFACTHCGRSAMRDALVQLTNGACDPVFRLPVWLSANCRRGTLWAYNLRHLEALEAFVAASLRERRPDPELGWSNRAWTSRLPRWVTAAKHRDDVLQCIARMRQK